LDIAIKETKNGIGTMQILTAPMAAAKSHFLRCLLPIQLRGRCTVRLLLSHTKRMSTQTINAAALCRMAFTKIEGLKDYHEDQYKKQIIAASPCSATRQLAERCRNFHQHRC
jgi:hypothetical protein